MRRLYPGPADTLLPKRCSARALVSVADKDVAPSHAGRLLAPGGTPERVPQPHQAEIKQRVIEGDHHLNPDRRRERDYGSAKAQQDAGTPRQHASPGDRDTKRDIADAEHQAGDDQLPQPERRPRTEIGEKRCSRPPGAAWQCGRTPSGTRPRPVSRIAEAGGARFRPIAAG